MNLTQEEQDKILAAAASTWDCIYGDVLDMCSEGEAKMSLDTAIEMVIDADRIVTLGGLDKELNEKFCSAGWDEVRKFMRKNGNRWY